jgi:hypothetical protein
VGFPIPDTSAWPKYSAACAPLAQPSSVHIPVERVYAVLEVKAGLSGKHLEDFDYKVGLERKDVRTPVTVGLEGVEKGRPDRFGVSAG